MSMSGTKLLTMTRMPTVARADTGTMLRAVTQHQLQSVVARQQALRYTINLVAKDQQMYKMLGDLVPLVLWGLEATFGNGWRPSGTNLTLILKPLVVYVAASGLMALAN
jgi:UV DNA damage repair endonuclease